MPPILVTCYVDPDLDGTASALAYAEFLNKTGCPAVAGIVGEPSLEVAYLLERFEIEWPLRPSGTSEYDRITLVDASYLADLEGQVDPESVIEIIDHRKADESNKFPNAKIQIELVGAAATLIAEKFFENNIEISQNAARALCGGIISNTLNFRGPIVTDRDHQAFERLNQIAKLPENFAHEMFVAKSDLSGERLAQEIRGGAAVKELGGKKVGIVQIEIVGAENLFATRRDELVSLLQEIKTEQNFDFIFLTIVDLEKYQNHLLVIDRESEDLVSQALDVTFENGVAIRKELLMRKLIVPKLKEVLEK